MRIKSICRANKKLLFVVHVALLFGALFSTMNTFGEDRGKCIEGDCYDGGGTYTYSDGSKYVGEWKDGKMNGKLTATFPDGSKYVGGWKDGKPHGEGIHILPDGTKIDRMQKDSKSQ